MRCLRFALDIYLHFTKHSCKELRSNFFVDMFLLVKDLLDFKAKVILGEIREACAPLSSSNKQVEISETLPSPT
jgi:hypothetical protein